MFDSPAQGGSNGLRAGFVEDRGDLPGREVVEVGQADQHSLLGGKTSQRITKHGGAFACLQGGWAAIFTAIVIIGTLLRDLMLFEAKLQRSASPMVVAQKIGCRGQEKRLKLTLRVSAEAGQAAEGLLEGLICQFVGQPRIPAGTV